MFSRDQFKRAATLTKEHFAQLGKCRRSHNRLGFGSRFKRTDNRNCKSVFWQPSKCIQAAYYRRNKFKQTQKVGGFGKCLVAVMMPELHIRQIAYRLVLGSRFSCSELIRRVRELQPEYRSRFDCFGDCPGLLLANRLPTICSGRFGYRRVFSP
jgi:hypothetical protein